MSKLRKTVVLVLVRQYLIRIATYEDVLAAPPHKVAEVIDGELHLNPRPGGPHARGASRLGSERRR